MLHFVLFLPLSSKPPRQSDLSQAALVTTLCPQCKTLTLQHIFIDFHIKWLLFCKTKYQYINVVYAQEACRTTNLHLCSPYPFHIRGLRDFGHDTSIIWGLLIICQ